MGIQPPSLGVFAAKRRIRADSKLRDVPIIAVTLSDHEAEACCGMQQVCGRAGPSAATGHGG